MTIIHLVSQDSGGAGRACVRLHKALLESNINSIILTANKTNDMPNIHRVAKSKIQKLIEKIRPHLSQLPLFLYKKRHKDIFSPNLPFFNLKNKNLISLINDLKPDLIHLHWIEGGFMNIKDLKDIKVPMLWSLHDANPYTGGCHYVASSCIRVGNHCKKCPLLNSKISYDLSYFTFKRKKNVYKSLKNLTINGLSKWITKCAKESALLKDKNIINLPNPIDTTIFKPIEKSIAREIIKTNNTKKIISFGAIGATSTTRKGYFELKIALEKLSYKLKQECILIIFGASNGEVIKDIETHYLGILNDDITLTLIYSASHLFIMPSHLESFGQTALESLSCGTPVVAFDTSGLKDIISHKTNGYLAKCYDTNDLKNGIEWILNLDIKSYEELSNNARNSVIKKFDSNKIAKEYIKVYNKLIRGGVSHKLLLKLSLISLLSNNNQNKIIGFGAIGGSSIKRKGFIELKTAIELINNKENYELLVFGGNTDSIDNIKINSIGNVNDDNTLALIYNVCDVFVVPSLSENLSNTIMESLSCGTPVVAFDIGGNADMISHKNNGYIAKNIDDLKNGIEWILNLDIKSYEELSNNARNSVIKKFDSKLIASKYITTYKKILNIGGGI